MNDNRLDIIRGILTLGLIIAATAALFSWFSCKPADSAISPVPPTSPGKGDAASPVPATPADKRDAISGTTDSGQVSRNIVIDHTNWDWYNSQSQQVFDSVAAQKIFFSHASVGSNILSGFKALCNANSSKYPLSQTNAGASPPAQTKTGVIFNYARGNPGWSAKISSFETYVLNGWHHPTVDISINKFCYIDQDANLTTYLDSMAALETKYPTTRFIYFTMPLTTGKDSAASLRAQFNTSLRKWIAAHNNKVLFDLADIESANPGGVPQTFSYKGMDYENLYSGYTSDGGHLNEEGSRRAATGLYSLFGQTLNPPKVTP